MTLKGLMKDRRWLLDGSIVCTALVVRPARSNVASGPGQVSHCAPIEQARSDGRSSCCPSVWTPSPPSIAARGELIPVNHIHIPCAARDDFPLPITSSSLRHALCALARARWALSRPISRSHRSRLIVCACRASSGRSRGTAPLCAQGGGLWCLRRRLRFAHGPFRAFPRPCGRGMQARAPRRWRFPRHRAWPRSQGGRVRRHAAMLPDPLSLPLLSYIAVVVGCECRACRGGRRVRRTDLEALGSAAAQFAGADDDFLGVFCWPLLDLQSS
ncbi:hypothetical protein BC834DRAFT_78783 [Gloeopeniophorella convolvens]|nr:hypothetical protein BC834DRAFT_78783 [Gloeopeniophorella convolvens]